MHVDEDYLNQDKIESIVENNLHGRHWTTVELEQPAGFGWMTSSTTTETATPGIGIGC